MIKWGCRHPCSEPRVIANHRVCGDHACTAALIGGRIRAVRDPTTGKVIYFEEEEEEDQPEEIDVEEEEPASPILPQPRRRLKLTPSPAAPLPASFVTPQRPSPAPPAFRPQHRAKEEEEDYEGRTPPVRVLGYWSRDPEWQARETRKVVMDPWPNNGQDDELDALRLRKYVLDPILKKEERIEHLDLLGMILHYINDDERDVYRRLIQYLYETDAARGLVPDPTYYERVISATCMTYIRVLLDPFGIIVDHVLIPIFEDPAMQYTQRKYVRWERHTTADALKIEYESRPLAERTPLEESGSKSI